MLWGSFGVVHFATLAIAAAMLIGVYYLLKYLPQKARTIVLFCLSMMGIVAVVFNLVRWGTPLEYLPLHMCSISAILLPIVVLTRNRTIGNLLLVWCLGSLLALIFNSEGANFVIPSATFFFFYIPHAFEFGVMIYLFKLGYVKLDYRCIPSTIGLTMGIYTLVHLANLLINHLCLTYNITNPSGNLVQVNYMLSLDHCGNPAMALFYKLIPYDFWYMYAAVIILLIYLPLVYLPQIVRDVKARRAHREG
jgi:uncharacterized membrane protein YwaF